MEINLSPDLVMHAAMQRLTTLTRRYGITSPEVLACCRRWGAILDDVRDHDRAAE